MEQVDSEFFCIDFYMRSREKFIQKNQKENNECGYSSRRG
jgi:hypothetical protein